MWRSDLLSHWDNGYNSRNVHYMYIYFNVEKGLRTGKFLDKDLTKHKDHYYYVLYMSMFES